MYLELVRDKSEIFPEVEQSSDVQCLVLWHCKYKTFQPLKQFTNLRALKIATYPDVSLDFVAELQRIEWLSIMHLPKITDLTPLSAMKSLRYLEIQTLPSWDASGKRTLVDSLVPLTQLPSLAHLSLLRVVPQSKSLAELTGCSALGSAKFLGYSAQEIEYFFSRSPKVINQHIPCAELYFPNRCQAS